MGTVGGHPHAWFGSGNFLGEWREAALRPQTWSPPVSPRSVCLKGRSSQARRAGYSVKGPQPPPLAQEAPAGQVGAWLHPAGLCSSSRPSPPQASLLLAQPCLSDLLPRDPLPGGPVSPSPFQSPRLLYAVPGGPSPWRPCTPLVSKATPLGKYSLGSLGTLGCPPAPALAQDTPLGRNKFGGLPGAWARLGAALLLLVVAFSLAARQLYTGADPTGSLGSAAPRPGGHPHHPGVYHHGAIVSPAGQSWGAAPGRGGPGALVPGHSPNSVFLAVATCSHLGRELLAAGGNVVDAGVGAALCLAVVHPHATGLGQ